MWEKIEKLYTDISRPSKRLIINQLSHWYYELGYYHFSQNEFTKARIHLRQALSKKPFLRMALIYYLATFLPRKIIDGIRRSKEK